MQSNEEIITNQNTHTIIYYDGYCGLCHAWVRFTLDRDRDGSKFKFSPLKDENPGSMIVRTETGEMLIRSSAVFYIMKRLGGGWRILASICEILPLRFTDFIYNIIASVRRRIFKTPDQACPIVPPHIRDRFI